MSQTALMIYPEEKTAASVAKLLGRQEPNFSWMIVRVTAGWQVAPIKKLAASPPKALPLSPSENVKAVLAKVGAVVKIAKAATLDIIVPVDHDTKDWIYFDKPLGTVPWWCIHKGSVVGRVQLDGKNQRLTVKTKAVHKYGLNDFVVVAKEGI